MAKLTRLTGKVFAGTADLEDLGVFGSAKAGNPTNPTGTNTEAQIQSGTAYDEGWTSAVVTSRNFPPVEEVNGVLRTISYQNCYILQEGIPEYDVGTEYSNTSIVKDINGSQLTLYVSLINNNIGNPLTDTDSWAQVTINNAPSNSNLYDGQWTVKPYTIGGSYYKIGTYSFTSNMNSYLDSWAVRVQIAQVLHLLQLHLLLRIFQYSELNTETEIMAAMDQTALFYQLRPTEYLR